MRRGDYTGGGLDRMVLQDAKGSGIVMSFLEAQYIALVETLEEVTIPSPLKAGHHAEQRRHLHPEF